MTTELVEALYEDSALLLKLPPGDTTAFHVKPNFAALENAKEMIRGKFLMTHHTRPLCVFALLRRPPSSMCVWIFFFFFSTDWR